MQNQRARSVERQNRIHGTGPMGSCADGDVHERGHDRGGGNVDQSDGTRHRPGGALRLVSRNEPLSLGSGALVCLRPHGALVCVSRGRHVLVMGPDGFVAPNGRIGLWSWETRVLSVYRWLIDGQAPEPAGASPVTQSSWLGYYIRSAPRSAGKQGAKPSQRTIALRLLRRIDDGLQEDVELSNWSGEPARLRVELQIDADFIGINEAGKARKQSGRLTRAWTKGRRSLHGEFEYRAHHAYAHQGDAGTAFLARGITIDVRATVEPRRTRHGVLFELTLAPRATARMTIRCTPTVDGQSATSSPGSRPARIKLTGPTVLVTGLVAHASVMSAALSRARDDLESLELPDLGAGANEVTIAAGVPTYDTFFGRDSLVTAYQSLWLGTAIARGTLTVHDQHLSDRRDDWRDAQPGRLVHELHRGPLATLNFTPHGRYYGDVTANLFCPLVLDELWRWTGDRALVARHLPTARRAVEWLERDGDLDGDGLYEFKTRSSQGEKNQNWKDSSQSLLYPDGRLVPDPVATCETQAYAHEALMALAHLLACADQPDEAARLAGVAARLRHRFNEAFWVDGEGTYAMAVDAQGRQVRSIGSDPGHCLGTGICEGGRARRVAERLMAPDLFSGWGVRTLSSRHAGYDPFSYQRGAVWPVENAMIAVGLSRRGMHDHLWRVVRAQLEAASLFPGCRLPEVFGGHARDEHHPFPGLYPNANSPQAWSASAVMAFARALLGIEAYAPMNVIFVAPALPAWLPELVMHGLRVGHSRVSLIFTRRSDDRTDVEVLEREGPIEVVQQERAWELTHGPACDPRNDIARVLGGQQLRPTRPR